MTKRIIVNKFGGGILKKELFPIIVKRLKEQLSKGFSPIVVVSAMPGITDDLVNFASKIKNKTLHESEANIQITEYINHIKDEHVKIMKTIGLNTEIQNKTQIELDKLFFGLEEDLMVIMATSTTMYEDKIFSYGEKISATILNNYFNSLGIISKRIFAEEIPIITDSNYKNANIEYEKSETNLVKKLSKINEVPVIAGFTGVTKEGHTTTLGRGGTDTTACFIGAALRAHKVILWKDVGGVLSADPKIVPKAKIIPTISYQEAEESGKIIHDKAISYLKLFKTPIDITSITDPKLYTQIKEIKKIEKGTKIISYKKNLTLFLITDEKIKTNEQLLIVSQAFDKYKVDMTLISNTRHSLQIVADDNNGQINKAYKEIESKVDQIKSISVNMIFLVGNFNVNDVNKFNDTLIKLDTKLQISAFLYENCTRLEAVVETCKIEEAIKVLYKKFIKK